MSTRRAEVRQRTAVAGRKGRQVNAQSGQYGNAVQAASSKGYLGIVQFLVGKGVEANAQGGMFGNALRAVSSKGYLDVVLTTISYIYIYMSLRLWLHEKHITIRLCELFSPRHPYHASLFRSTFYSFSSTICVRCLSPLWSRLPASDESRQF